MNLPDEPKTSTLVPPRPNLGPEPWPEGPRWTATTGGLLVGMAFLLGLVGLRIWHRRRRKRSPVPGSGAEILASEVDQSPRRRLIAASERVRDELIRAFGPAWSSKTTEEIGDNAGLRDRLDPLEIDRLIEFLKLADRAKFANAELEAVDDWESWTGELAGRLSRPPPKSGSK